ncbi:hypothetical protein [Pendulispora albinea]|uniref:Uncharacterized protein n=1 Tax=Pendulispora albinea TaxID=2741071 RepID=A0ABZ2M2E4_9BACT
MLVLVSYETPADAALTITLGTPIKRVKPDGSNADAHPQGVLETTLTKEDCDKDVRIRFPLNLQGIDDSHNLEIWSGASCETTTSRTSATATCGQVAATIGGGSLKTAITVDIRVQDLAQQLNANPKNVQYTPANSSACDSQATTGAQSITIYFLWLANSASAPDGSQTTQVQLSTKGPKGPDSVTAGEGDRVLVIRWNAPSGVATSISGYDVFCDPVDSLSPNDPAPSDGGTTDAGSTLVCPDGGFTDAGPDASGTPIDAGPCVLVPNDGGGGGGGGGACPYTPKTKRTTVQSTASTSATVKDLVNGVQYACAVAAIDKAKNSGELSSAACGTPGPVGDFFYRYREAGGLAGGCALEGAPVTDGVVIGAASMFGLALVRRRRKGKRS